MTLRSDTRTDLHTWLGVFQAANSGLRQVRRARPANFNELPLAYVGGIRERLAHDPGTRRRDMEADIVFVDMVTDNEEAVDRLDDLADAAVDALTAAPHAVTNAGFLEPARSESAELDVGGVPYAAVVVTVRVYQEVGRG